MKFDKRLVVAAAIAMGIGFGFSACDDDSDTCDADKVKAECTKAGKDFDADKCECKDKTCDADKVKAECTKAGKDFDADKCECKDKTCDVEAERAKCTDKQTFDEANCKCVDKLACDVEAERAKCTDKQTFDEVGCKCVDNKPTTCGNNADTVDEGEFCDYKDGKAVFADDSKATCEEYIKAYPEQFPGGIDKWEFAADGKPGCAKTCLAFDKGSCNVKAKTCGNSQIDENEKCETVEGKAMVSDGKGGMREATCVDHDKTTYKDGEYTGAPTCNERCNGLGKGTCHVGAELPAIKGFKSCTISDVKNESKKITATATVVREGTFDVVGAIYCADSATKLGVAYGANKEVLDIQEGLTITSTFDASSLAAGSCVFYVVDKTKNPAKDGVICSEDGTVKLFNGGLTVGENKFMDL